MRFLGHGVVQEFYTVAHKIAPLLVLQYLNQGEV